MAQYWEDWSGEEVGALSGAPTGWTARWVTTGVTLAIVSDAAAPSGKSLRLSKSAAGRFGLSLDALDSDANRATVNMSLKFRAPANPSDGNAYTNLGMFARGSGSASSESAYIGAIGEASNDNRYQVLQKYTSGTWGGITTPNHSSSYMWEFSTVYWLHLSISGSTLRYRISSSSTPGTYFYDSGDITDASISSAGWGGIYLGAKLQQEVLAIGIGTNGDAAPLEAPGDTTAPTLSLASGTKTGTTTATGAVTTDEANGTLYAVATTSATAPSAAQVKAGQDHTGSAAVWDDSQAVSSASSKEFSATGLTADTAYYFHFMHEDAAENQSDVASSASFTTDAEAVPTKGVSLTLYNGTTPLGAITGIVALWWDATTPSGAPDFETATASTTADGLLEIDIDADTALDFDDEGFLLLYKLDATDHKDSLVFAGRVVVSDIA